MFQTEKSRLPDCRNKMLLLSNAAGPDSRPDNDENEKIEVNHTEDESGQDFPLLGLDGILQKVSNDDDPEIRIHSIHSLRKHTVKSPKVVDDIVAMGTLVPMLVSSLRSSR